MTIIRVKGFKIFKDRHGKQRCYHRASGVAIDLTKAPIGSAEFFAECARLSTLYGNRTEHTKPGTLGKLITEYKKHASFIDLAPRTKKDYDRIFNYLKPIRDTPLIDFTTPLIVKIRDKAAGKMGRKWGNYTRSTLAMLFSWGKERGYIDTNPASQIKSLKRPKDQPQANRPWTDEERYTVLAALSPVMALPITLMMYCGIDPIDVVSLPRAAIKNGMIDTRRAKTAEPVWIPLPDTVRKCMEKQPLHDALTVCVNSRGLPWTTDGLNSNWQRLKKKLETEGKVSKGLTLKGLRHTVATILAEMGYDDRTIADMLGQRTLAMAQHYSRRANRSKKLTNVIERFETEMHKRKTKVVKPS